MTDKPEGVSAPMDPKFTPGPWERSDVWPTRVQCSGRGEEICDTRYASEKTRLENFANAALISAAPDLYAALQCVIENVEGGSYESTGQAIDSARMALARARGERVVPVHPDAGEV